MKKTLLLMVLLATTAPSSVAQTLDVDPLFAGGVVGFEVHNATPGSLAFFCFSQTGAGPHVFANGLSLELSLPIKLVSLSVVDTNGDAAIGPFSVPSAAPIGFELWFQAVFQNTSSSPVWSASNMVASTIRSMVPPDMVAISGGVFEMGDHAGVGVSDEQPVHSITLDGFYMDTHEVTNQKFCDFINAANVTVVGVEVFQSAGAGEKLCYLSLGLSFNGMGFIVDTGKENKPVVNLTWYGAALYCNYLSTLYGRTPRYSENNFSFSYTADGFRLPTEAEWEFASRGGEHNPYYQYPWASDSISQSDANYDYNNNPTASIDVGGYPPNGYGLYDMGGNVWEWCGDWYVGDYYSYSPPNNPFGESTGLTKVFRGGSWYSSSSFLRSANRHNGTPDNINNNLGFRVVATH
jgi:formylglycine-generating enzyme required for sulfatase activity